MKTHIRTILRDIQAAARIGHIESLWAVLESLEALPQVAGNHPLDETFINQVILPVGEAVAGARVSAAALRPLNSHPIAAIRAILAVALLDQVLAGKNGIHLEDLTALTQDPRKDVRLAISLAAASAGEDASGRLVGLYQDWQASSSPHTQAIAYAILPSLPDGELLVALNGLEGGLSELRPEVKVDLASALATLGAGTHRRKVLGLLTRWANLPEPDHRLIARCLVKPWAAEEAGDVLRILTTLAENAGPQKRIRQVLLNLSQHGAHEEVNRILKDWENSGHPNLVATAQDEELDLPHKE